LSAETNVALEEKRESLPPVNQRLTSESLNFPGDDGGRSLNEMAARDLEVTLQLLVERAQYITGASGAAIALCEGEEMVCRASSGSSAPAVGTRAEISSGLSGESVRTREIVCCNDVASDSRVDGESCKSVGIAAVIVMPLVRQGRVIGVFELLSDRAQAFEERDLVALERLGEMIQTAIDHAEGLSQAEAHTSGEENAEVSRAVPVISASPKASLAPAANRQTVSSPKTELRNTGRCSACGFPVAEGQTLCLDCRNSRLPQSTPQKSPVMANRSQAHFEVQSGNETWWQSHKYLIGTVLAAVITVTAVIFFR